jgi:hypothetical protein
LILKDMAKLVATCALLAVFCGCGKKAAQDQPVSIMVEQCAVNMGHIDAAKNKWAEEHNAGTNGTPAAEDLDPYFRGGMPRCPEGGTYTIGKVGEPPQCSIAAHNDYFRTNNTAVEGAAPAAKP